jgi:hypothetical protein
MGKKTGVLFYQKIKEGIDLKWGWRMEDERKEVIVLLCPINVKMTLKQTKEDSGFTTHVKFLTPDFKVPDVTGIETSPVHQRNSVRLGT